MRRETVSRYDRLRCSNPAKVFPEHPDPIPRFDLHDLGDAVAEIATEDLDYLYGQRMLNQKAQAQGPEGDAARAANSIAYRPFDARERGVLAKQGQTVAAAVAIWPFTVTHDSIADPQRMIRPDHRSRRNSPHGMIRIPSRTRARGSLQTRIARRGE